MRQASVPVAECCLATYHEALAAMPASIAAALADSSLRATRSARSDRSRFSRRMIPVREQNQLLSVFFGLPQVNKARKRDSFRLSRGLRQNLRQAHPGPLTLSG